MDFKALITSLKAGDTDKALEIAESLQPKFEQTIAELSTFEGKLSDAVNTRDKAKGKIKTLADVFGITEDDLTPEKAKELLKVNKNGDEYKADIENLTKLLAEKDVAYNSSLAEKDNLFKDKLIEIDIAKIGINSDVVNDKALSLVVSALKTGATIEDGAIVYKDANGAIIRNGAGRPKDVSEMMADFKSDASNSFLFKATNNGGGGAQSTGAATTKKFSEYNGAELVELNRTNPAEYQRLKNQ